MKKNPADLMREATHLLLKGDAAGAAALFQSAVSGHSPETTETETDNQASEPGHSAQDSTQAAEVAANSFTEGVYSHHDARLGYKLFIPAGENDNPVPLLVMLHGCNQSAQDFAVSTGMNAIAQASGMCVLYPAQSSSANPNKCWNWFEPAHQLRGSGEPELLSALTLHIMESQAIDPQRVFVAGFSAGGAMALTLAEQYPELYAAVGVHSGLPTGAAFSNMDALRLMQSGPTGDASSTGHADVSTVDSTEQDATADSGQSGQMRQVGNGHTPLIVFHGSQDRIVNPANADRIVANWLAREQTRADPIHWMPLTVTHTSATGRNSIVTTYVAEEQAERIGCEYWQLSQGGHAWSGGNGNSSYSDKNGPDASAEMVRFFLECTSAEHRRP